ncbi:Spo0E family sporulation regulatory protein-aspartic acid phosphatase [Sporosarcina sp. A2]|uniref:Spo0E family sporulation regulatory protein-aspartic acid phosphatase n=1 Tax=Sporosarcina sp. A2 TaxID=3393449 RepID=UPI003D7B4ED8
MEDLESKIESIRIELLKTAEERGLSSTETIKLSVELDHLLNIYSYDEKGSNSKTNCYLRNDFKFDEKFG